jgi:hypothetical protein
MAFNAAWGASNDKKYGKTMGEWDGHKARHTTHLDALTEALEEAPVVKYVDLLVQSASWGAANERAFGRHRSGAQVDWDMFHEHGRKIKSLVNNDEFVDHLISAAKSAAWYAANKYSYGEGNQDTKNDLSTFKDAIAGAKKTAPANWPMHEVQEVFRYAALGAAAHRIAQVEDKKKNRGKDHQFHLQYEDTPNREDWSNYHKAAVDLKKELGPEQKELFEQFEGMAVESAWGAACERTHGKHSNDAKVHWRKFQAHNAEAKGLYKGQAAWDDIHQMITSAAWGAANERAYGESNEDARGNWREFERAAGKVIATHGGEL